MKSLYLEIFSQPFRVNSVRALSLTEPLPFLDFTGSRRIEQPSASTKLVVHIGIAAARYGDRLTIDGDRERRA